MKRIADEVAVESTNDVTVDSYDKAAGEVIVDIMAGFDDKVEYSQSESLEESDSTKIVLEVANLHLAPVICSINYC